MYERFGLFIDNEWRSASDQASKPVISPVSEEVVGAIPMATDADIAAAIESADAGFRIWREAPAWRRASVLRRAADILRERNAGITHMISAETGKPLAEARSEAAAAADQFEWCAEEAKRIYGQTIPGRTPDDRLSVIYQPVGVCLALSAWNFPALLPARKIAAALAAGCAIIARPASEAPGACFAIAQALKDAGLDKGSPVIRKVSLTGSVPVGKRILSLCAQGVKKVTMELGGHAPVIVHADADPIAAARKVAAAKFRNCGQVCISPSRFFVHESIKPAFEAEFAQYAQTLVVGDGLIEGVTMGPMIRDRAVSSALLFIEDAVNRGARVLAGGKRPANLNKGNFIEPTVLTDVPDAARIMREEPFAPVAPIAAFTELDDVLKRANAVPYGLAAYVFTHDSALADLTAEGLEAGMVGVNDALLATAEAPFGGIKESGFGREGGSLGIKDYLEPKYIRRKLVIRSALA
jgi:succinate-semialdehyde dehydrogenase/glutarate-semialdehyde dehydrogenase